MKPSVVGLGLVSPAGCTPAEHAFFLRAGLFAPPASAFVSPEGDPLKVHHCPWLGAHMPLAERLQELALRAVDEAILPVSTRLPEGQDLTTLLVGPPGGLDGLRATLRSRRCRVDSVWPDVSAALFAATELFHQGAGTVVVAAVDSFVDLAIVDEQWRRRPGPWQMIPPPLSEGAAAVVLCTDQVRRDLGVGVYGALLGASVVVGLACDENEEPCDGLAMTKVLRDVAPHGVARLLGPYENDDLRRQEIHLAVARCSAAFSPRLRYQSIELMVGRLGLAGLLADLVFGLADSAYGTVSPDAEAFASLVAWSVTTRGTRGAVAALAGGPSGHR